MPTSELVKAESALDHAVLWHHAGSLAIELLDGLTTVHIRKASSTPRSRARHRPTRGPDPYFSGDSHRAMHGINDAEAFKECLSDPMPFCCFGAPYAPLADDWKPASNPSGYLQAQQPLHHVGPKDLANTTEYN